MMKALLMLVSGVGPRGGSRWIGINERGETLCVEQRQGAAIAELALQGASAVEVIEGIKSRVVLAAMKIELAMRAWPREEKQNG